MFPTAAESCRAVSGLTSKESWSNFVIRVDIGDSPKERFERTEPTRALFLDVCVTNERIERCIPEVPL